MHPTQNQHGYHNGNSYPPTPLAEPHPICALTAVALDFSTLILLNEGIHNGELPKIHLYRL